MYIIIQVILILILLVLSGFFSGSETAFFSLTPLDLRKLHHRGVPTRKTRILLRHPARLLTTILIGNLLVNVAISSIGTSIFIKFIGESGVGYAVIVITIVLLIFGEVAPKRIAIQKRTSISLFASGILLYMQKYLKPILKIVAKYLSFQETRNLLSEEEFKDIIDAVHKKGVVKGHEREMVHAVLEFTDTSVREVMTPRVDIKALPEDLPMEQAINLLKEYRHSKVPVYRKQIDKVMGILYTKDIMLNSSRSFIDYIRPVLFVPETKKIDEILGIFQKQNIKIAIVVDEFGGTSGLVTLEDILEEIFGEIYDEYEIIEKNVEKIGTKKYRIVGKLPINEFNEYFNSDIAEEEEEYDTISGFIMDRLGKIPLLGEYVEEGGYKLIVENMAGKRITTIIVEEL